MLRPAGRCRCGAGGGTAPGRGRPRRWSPCVAGPLEEPLQEAHVDRVVGDDKEERVGAIAPPCPRGSAAPGSGTILVSCELVRDASTAGGEGQTDGGKTAQHHHVARAHR